MLRCSLCSGRPTIQHYIEWNKILKVHICTLLLYIRLHCTAEPCVLCEHVVLSVHESMRNGSSGLLKRFHLTGHCSTLHFSRIYLAICSDSVTKKLENTQLASQLATSFSQLSQMFLLIFVAELDQTLIAGYYQNLRL